MPVMRMGVPCTVSKRGGYDVYGKEVYDGGTYATKCSVVDMAVIDDKTTVRVDSSATKGNAREITIDARLLMSKNDSIAIGDRIVCMGKSMKIVRISPRHNVVGKLDHYEVECSYE